MTESVQLNRGAFNLDGLGVVPIGIQKPVDGNNNGPRHQAARDRESHYEQANIPPSEVNHHAETPPKIPTDNRGRATWFLNAAA
jgi:hypothetical protein